MGTNSHGGGGCWCRDGFTWGDSLAEIVYMGMYIHCPLLRALMIQIPSRSSSKILLSFLCLRNNNVIIQFACSRRSWTGSKFGVGKQTSATRDGHARARKCKPLSGFVVKQFGFCGAITFWQFFNCMSPEKHTQSKTQQLQRSSQMLILPRDLAVGQKQDNPKMGCPGKWVTKDYLRFSWLIFDPHPFYQDPTHFQSPMTSLCLEAQAR